MRETLEALLARVEAATGPDQELDGDLAVALEGWTLRKFEGDKRPYWRDAKHSNQENYFARKDGPPRYTASIDAAVALVEKKLPGAEYSISTLYHLAQVELPLNAHEGPQAARREDMHVPLTMIAALLRALIAAAGPDCLRKGPVEATAVPNEQSKYAPIKPSEKEG